MFMENFILRYIVNGKNNMYTKNLYTIWNRPT